MVMVFGRRETPCSAGGSQGLKGLAKEGVEPGALHARVGGPKAEAALLYLFTMLATAGGITGDGRGVQGVMVHVLTRGFGSRPTRFGLCIFVSAHKISHPFI